MAPIELQLCDIQGRLFKLSVGRGINSAEFIKVFMKSATAKALDSTYNRMQWAGEEYLLEEVIDEAGGSYAMLFCRQGADLWSDTVCKLVPFFMPWKHGYGFLQSTYKAKKQM